MKKRKIQEQRDILRQRKIRRTDAISADGPRAYAPFTDEDIKRELILDEYREWADARADEARRAMDEDTEYQSLLLNRRRKGKGQ